MHQERTNKHANDDAVPDGAVPAYLLDREGVSRAKVLSNTVKQKRKEKAGKWDVPIPKVSVAIRAYVLVFSVRVQCSLWPLFSLKLSKVFESHLKLFRGWFAEFTPDRYRWPVVFIAQVFRYVGGTSCAFIAQAYLGEACLT